MLKGAITNPHQGGHTDSHIQLTRGMMRQYLCQALVRCKEQVRDQVKPV